MTAGRAIEIEILKFNERLSSADNSGFHPLLTSVPVVEFPMKIKIGTTDIKVEILEAGNFRMLIPTNLVHNRGLEWE